MNRHQFVLCAWAAFLTSLTWAIVDIADASPVTSGLVLDLEANDSQGTGGNGLGTGNTWVNKAATGSTYNATLLTRNGGTATWIGDGTPANPYALQLQATSTSNGNGSFTVGGGYAQVNNTFNAGSALDLTTFTYEVWVKGTGVGSGDASGNPASAILSHSTNTVGQGNGGIEYSAFTSPSLGFQSDTLFSQGGTSTPSGNGGSIWTFPNSNNVYPEPANGYQQIVQTRTDGSPTGTAWYLDGTLMGKFQSHSNSGSQSWFEIGARSFGNTIDLFADADIGIVRLYSTPLTATQVLQNFQADAPQFAVSERAPSILAVPSIAATADRDTRAARPIDIQSQLELLTDDHLLDFYSGLTFVLHTPTKREIAIAHDALWEGNNCSYHTVFQDDDRVRMYYMIAHNDCGPAERRANPPRQPILTGYAESKDGVHWEKPFLGQFEFGGNKQNNVLTFDGFDREPEAVLVPFKDRNSRCPPQSRYKALVRIGSGLVPYHSADALHWSRMANEPSIVRGAFDSENLAFWDVAQGNYVAYFRDFREGRRDIRTARSDDFVHWSEPVWLEYPGSAPQELYTNQITAYERAPHLFLGFPTRYVDRGWTASLDLLPELEHRQVRSKASPRYGTAITDGLFMSSRDGIAFRRWDEAFLRPGPQELGHWIYGDQYQAWGIVETDAAEAGAPRELSIYTSEGTWRGTGNRLRRYTLRMDGFVSLNAPLRGGELVTRPLMFAGRRLTINFSTSAAGSVQVELQNSDGQPIAGYALADCPEVFGDSIERTVAWRSGSDLGSLAGQPVRMRILLRDADLYSFRFE